jgi:hypothetical protein
LDVHLADNWVLKSVDLSADAMVYKSGWWLVELSDLKKVTGMADYSDRI